MIANILDMMDQLSELYEEIRQESLKKRGGIVDNKVEVVSDAVKREWELLGQIASLEEKRAAAVAEALGRERHAGEGAGTVSELAAVAPEDERKRLEAAAERLRGQVEAQKELNEQIQMLVDVHLEYTDYMVNMVFSEPQVSNIYGKGGGYAEDEPNTGAQHGIIDSQA